MTSNKKRAVALLALALVISKIGYDHETGIHNGKLVVSLDGFMFIFFALILAYLFYERHKKHKVIYNLAYKDTISKLGNRNAYFSYIGNICHGRARHKPWCLISLNIHNFSWINDTFGTHAGNKVLKKIGALLSHNYAQDGEKLARLHGDVFFILKPLKNWDEPRSYIENVLRDIGKISYEGNALRMKATAVGMLFTPSSIKDGYIILDSVMKAQRETADRLNNQIIFCDKDFKAKVLAESQLVEKLKTAIAQDKIKVYYQAKYNPNTETLIGAEALARWKQDDRYISPGLFITLAEKKGLVWDITQQVFTKVCRDLEAWHRQGLNVVPISVNISARDLYQKDLYIFLKQTLQRYNVRPEEIELEITETCIMQDTGIATVVLGSLKSLGFKIDIDDFGTGYSSLSYLQAGLFDIIKLDRSFLLHRDKFKNEGEKLISSIIALVKNLGLKCICEGAETKDQVGFLAAAGCDGIQGFYYAKPVPEQEFRMRLNLKEADGVLL